MISYSHIATVHKKKFRILPHNGHTFSQIRLMFLQCFWCTYLDLHQIEIWPFCFCSFVVSSYTSNKFSALNQIESNNFFPFQTPILHLFFCNLAVQCDLNASATCAVMIQQKKWEKGLFNIWRDELLIHRIRSTNIPNLVLWHDVTLLEA